MLYIDAAILQYPSTVFCAEATICKQTSRQTSIPSIGTGEQKHNRIRIIVNLPRGSGQHESRFRLVCVPVASYGIKYANLFRPSKKKKKGKRTEVPAMP